MMSGSQPVVRQKAKEKNPYILFAPTAPGLEEILAGELRRVGAVEIAPATRGVSFAGSKRTIYQANLWLRTAHRVLWQLAVFDAPDRQALYAGAQTIDWSEHMTPDGTLAVDAVSHRSSLTHTQFVAQVIKDAVVDRFRSKSGRRPSVDRHSADLRINARLYDNRCTLSIDTSGERLHRRGYRPGFGTPAPLQETLAAGIVLLSGYEGKELFVDPMCGSGTLLVEAALIARNMAPGLLGRRFGLMTHPAFDHRLWADIVGEARAMVHKRGVPSVVGSDVSEEALRATRAAVSGAGLDDVVRIRRADVADLPLRDNGRVVTNPPYGERLGELNDLADLYTRLGQVLKDRCRGMSAHIFTSSKFLASKLGLRSYDQDVLFNGPLECRLLHYEIF